MQGHDTTNVVSLNPA